MWLLRRVVAKTNDVASSGVSEHIVDLATGELLSFRSQDVVLCGHQCYEGSIRCNTDTDNEYKGWEKERED